MSRIFRYIAWKYTKNFAIIFLGLVLFYVGFDYMQASKRLPESANLRMLYVYYQALFASDILTPVALVFALVATKLFLIRSNELVAFYAIGYTKAQVLRPFIVVASLIIALYMLAHNTKYAYAEEYVRSIYSSGKISRVTQDLFFKYNQYYVYFATLYPMAQKAEKIRIFKQQNGDIIEIIKSDEAFYQDEKWLIPHARKIVKQEQLSFDSIPMEILQDGNIEILRGFKPDVLDHIHEGKVHYSIEDAITAIGLLNAQEANPYKVYSALYSMIIYPFFVPALMIIIFFFVPISSRMLNVSLFSFLAILSTLLVWGLLFAFTRLAHGGVFSPEVGIILPVFLLISTASIVWLKKAR